MCSWITTSTDARGGVVVPEAGTTENVQWVAEAGFLAEPYRGPDADVPDGRYMAAMVSTFEGTDLVMAEAPAE